MIEQFKQYLMDLGRSEQTIKLYASDIGIFENWFRIDNGYVLTPKTLTPSDIRNFKRENEDRKLAPKTINRRLAAIHALVAYWMQAKLIDYDPAQNIKLAEEQELAPKWLDKLQQAALIRALEKERSAARTEISKVQAIRDKTIFILIMNTGLRIGEACALQFSDIQIGERSGQARVMNGKRDKSRNIPLNNTARQALKDWLLIRPQVKNDYIFITKLGERIHPRSLQLKLVMLSKHLGFDLTPHMLRHTCAKNLVDAGIPLNQIAAILGHNRLETTKIYITPSQADLAKAVEKLE